MKKLLIPALATLSSVAVVFAADSVAANGDAILKGLVAEVFSPLYKLTVGIASVYFMYGVAKFIYDMNDPEKKNTGKGHLLWGTIGLFIILSAGAILSFFEGMFGGVFTS